MSDHMIVSDAKDASAEDREIWVKPVARTRNLAAAELGPTGSTDFCASS